jgi:membrane-bound lytic murein transglycosylase D
MCLPSETKNYVPQMIAATIIAKNPEKFGFKNVPYLPPLAVEKVQVKEPTSLKAAAVAVNVPVEEVQALNPSLLRGVTPPDEPLYTLNLPAKSKEIFSKNITLARIEHPAVASRPARYARSQASSPQHSRYAAAEKDENVRVRHSSKSSKKSKAVTAKSRKKGKTVAAAAERGKRGHQGQKSAAVRTASMLPISSPAKSAQKERTKLAVKDRKGKAKELAKAKTNSKKAGIRSSKKSETAAKSSKNSGKGGSASRRTKGKVSKASSKFRPVLVSKAR